MGLDNWNRVRSDSGWTWVWMLCEDEFESGRRCIDSRTDCVVSQ